MKDLLAEGEQEKGEQREVIRHQGCCYVLSYAQDSCPIISGAETEKPCLRAVDSGCLGVRVPILTWGSWVSC